ncbi:MAG: hypothetical protein AB7J34_11770, partial [Limisphaerales bacterium]
MKASMANSSGVTRRRFLEGTAATALGAVGAGEGWAHAGSSLADNSNPWRYDVDRLRRVDPALIGYERAGGFRVDERGLRRLTWAGPRTLVLVAGRSVVIFDDRGTRTGGFGTGDVARCVAVASDGRRVVGLRDRAEIYDGDGRLSAQWPVLGGRPFVTGLALSEDRVFVADSGNRVVYRCDWEGRIDLRLGERQPDRGIPGLVLPSPCLDVELGADGLLRITNPGRHRVEVYTQDGDLVQSWGRAGVGVDAFCGCCNPIAVDLLADGRVVTAEKGLPRVKVFEPSGRLETFV